MLTSIVAVEVNLKTALQSSITVKMLDNYFGVRGFETLVFDVGFTFSVARD